MSQSLIIQKQAGNTLTIIRQGANTGGAYTLPVATDATLGGVKIGAGLSANATGTLTTNATLIGLGSVNNTSDLDKPVSNATATALAGKAALVHTHVIGDVSGLQTALDAKLPTANFTYANLPGTPNLSVYYLATNPAGYITASCLTWSNTTGKPTFANVAISGLYSDLTGTPNLSLYLTVANATASYYPLTGNPSGFLSSSALTPYQTIANNTFANLSGKPTTLAGYGITDGLTSSTAASTYAPISTTVTLTGTQTLTNKTLFGTSLTGTTSIGGTTDLSGNLLQRAGVLPITVSSASYTLQQSDCGGLIVLTGTANQTITIPTGLSRGYNVSIFQKSAFSSTIAAGSGVTLYAKNGAKTSGQNAMVGIVDVGDANPPTGFSIGGDTTT